MKFDGQAVAFRGVPDRIEVRVAEGGSCAKGHRDLHEVRMTCPLLDLASRPMWVGGRDRDGSLEASVRVVFAEPGFADVGVEPGQVRSLKLRVIDLSTS